MTLLRHCEVPSLLRGNLELMEKQFFVYLMTNPTNTVTYTGVTSALAERIFQHKEKLVPGFTSWYNINKLVYYEEQADTIIAIAREKQIKSWSRKDKIKLITEFNPDWHDLYSEL